MTPDHLKILAILIAFMIVAASIVSLIVNNVIARMQRATDRDYEATVDLISRITPNEDRQFCEEFMSRYDQHD